MGEKNLMEPEYCSAYMCIIDYVLCNFFQTKDREAEQLWQELKPLMMKFFENIEIKPSLLHGDLWGGNIGETDTEPSDFFLLADDNVNLNSYFL